MSNKVVHVEVKLSDCGGDFDRMLRKFTKEVKREGVIDDVLDRRFFKKPSAIRNEKNVFFKRKEKNAKKMKKLQKK
jgi:ribosomal protein S21